MTWMRLSAPTAVDDHVAQQRSVTRFGGRSVGGQPGNRVRRGRPGAGLSSARNDVWRWRVR
jgi:hypothetical protein